jgi:2-polyprenyl-3-methyl-5-hydroxy-6-metoxy-1,4-benzoquinol methylase
MSQYRDASVELGANEFHKTTGIAATQRKTESEFKSKYVNTETGKIKGHLVTRRHCPVCDGDGGEVSFNKNGFDHILCSCGMVYIPEILKEEYLNLVYSGGEHEKETHDAFRAEPRNTFICEIYKAGLELIEKNGLKSRECLDVGCSSGLFLEYAISQGYKPDGIEPSDYAVEYGKQNGLNIIKGYFTADTFEKKYPLVTLWDVLEHCDDPMVILRDAYEVLDEDGLLFLQVPNVSALAPRIMRERCNMFNGYAHINLFGPDTLKEILIAAGFREFSFQTVISEISVINNYLDYSDPYFGPSTERDQVLNYIDIDFIEKNLLGYKVQVVARK